MRIHDDFEALDRAALATVQGGFAQILGMVMPLISGLMNKGKGGGAPPQQMAQAPAQAPPGAQAQPPPQVASPAAGSGDPRVQVTVATGPAALEAIKSAMSGGMSGLGSAATQLG